MNDVSVNENQPYQVISAFNIEEPSTKKGNEVPEPIDNENINAKPKKDKYKLPDLSI